MIKEERTKGKGEGGRGWEMGGKECKGRKGREGKGSY